ncbi:MAG: bifunctional methylenetetrahydrofolate dehydrogenase/methenyltetrahydrofolate cyclohydrolase FolD [Eubacterium sp.]|nr:bifunctional methylenetetrahydrofolate dehydrogenase/methenyltetrahydrofolate cyclohydrolase FolD [Eubacterium sp.]
MAKIIDGKAISAAIKDELKEQVKAYKEQGIEITLAVVKVGNDPASAVYVRNKEKACEYVGITSRTLALPQETTEEELLKVVEDLNNDSAVNGILVQLPLPKHIDESKILLAIDSNKDVDGFHPVNVGKMVIGEDAFLPCTPAGIIEMLKRSDIDIAGKECVVIGRSNIVGKPMSILMLKENATVTIAHSRTKDLKEVTKRADILIAAIGKAKFVTAEYVKEGAVVIDVGMDRDEDGKLCGDVDFASVEKIASAITPVPGGVGPMTVTMLLVNCLRSVELNK